MSGVGCRKPQQRSFRHYRQLVGCLLGLWVARCTRKVTTKLQNKSRINLWACGRTTAA
ncbi:unnamed protein product [Ectocarpus sp. 12 AP-2014]